MPVQPSADPAERRPRGRRAQGEDTREQIKAAARAEFAELGYDVASVRGIARRAGVDPALVRYWFEGGKAELFSNSLMNTQINPVRIAQAMAAGPTEGFGTRLVSAVLGVWDVPGGSERFRLVFASGFSGPGADGVRDYLTQEVFARVGKRLAGPDVQLRMNLVASQLVGLMLTRYGLRLEPLASTPLDVVARRVGPVIQQYLEPLKDPPPGVPDDPPPARPSEPENS